MTVYEVERQLQAINNKRCYCDRKMFQLPRSGKYVKNHGLFLKRK